MVKRKKKETPYLDFYEKCMEVKLMPEGYRDDNICGLCGYFGVDVMDLFKPTREDCLKYNIFDFGYWGAEGGHFQKLGFTPLRQTIVLFLSCMNDEY